MLNVFDKNKDGVIELEEVEDVVEDEAAVCGASLFRWLTEIIFGFCSRKHKED